jgi:hypothetical protein
MHRMPDIKHDVIGYVDNVIDRAQAGLFKSIFEPFWRWANLDVVNDARTVAWAMRSVFNFNIYVVFNAVFAIFVAERIAM